MPARISKQNFYTMAMYAIVPVLVMPSIAFSTAEVSIQPAIINPEKPASGAPEHRGVVRG